MPEDIIEQATEDQAAEDAGFSEGFASINNDGVKPPKPEPEPKAEPAAAEPAAAAPEPQPAPTPPPAPPAPSGPQLTPEQFAALVQRVEKVDTLQAALDKMAGHVGTLLERSKAPPAPAGPTLPTVDEEEFAATYAEFAGYTQQQLAKLGLPPDFAEKLKALESYEARIAAAESRPAITPQDLEFAREEARQLAKLDIQHEEWEQIVTSPAYAAWLSTQPAAFQQTANTTTSAAELGGVLTAYKAAAAKQERADKNRARLEGAVVPTGVPGARPSEPTEEDAFLAGFNSR